MGMTDDIPKGCQYAVGFLMAASMLLGLVPVVRWVAQIVGM